MKPRIVVKNTNGCTVIKTKTAKFGYDFVVLSDRDIEKYGIKETFLRALDSAVIGGFKATARSLGRMAEYMGVQA